MTPSEIRTKPSAELLKLVAEKKQQLFALKLQKMIGQLAKTAEPAKARLDIARILTILKEKTWEENQPREKQK